MFKRFFKKKFKPIVLPSESELFNPNNWQPIQAIEIKPGDIYRHSGHSLDLEMIYYTLRIDDQFTNDDDSTQYIGEDCIICRRLSAIDNPNPNDTYTTMKAADLLLFVQPFLVCVECNRPIYNEVDYLCKKCR